MKTFAALVVVLSLALSSCLLSDQDTSDRSLTGTWGGDHISIEFLGASAGADSVATIEYDCAFGIIAGLTGPDQNGRFIGTGTHLIGHGGPIREDEQLDAHPARYEITVVGTNMTLFVTMTDTDINVGTFYAKRGVTGSVFKCL